MFAVGADSPSELGPVAVDCDSLCELSELGIGVDEGVAVGLLSVNIAEFGREERVLGGRGAKSDESLFLGVAWSPAGVVGRDADDGVGRKLADGGTEEGRGLDGRGVREEGSVVGVRVTSVVWTTPCTRTKVPGGGK